MSTTQFAIPGLMPAVPQNLALSFTRAAPDGSVRMPIFKAPVGNGFHSFKVVVADVAGNILFADYSRAHIYPYRTADWMDYWLILDSGVLPIGSHRVHVNIHGLPTTDQPCRQISYNVYGVLVADTPWVAAGRSRYSVNCDAMDQGNALEDLISQIIRIQEASKCCDSTAAAVLQEMYGRLGTLETALLALIAANPDGDGESVLSRDVTSLVDGSRVEFFHADIGRAIAITLNGIVQVDVTFVGAVATLDNPPQPGDTVLLLGADEA